MTLSPEAAGRPGEDDDPFAGEEIEEVVQDPEPAAAAGIAGDVSADLSGLADRPVEEHPEVYEAIHRRLGHTLSAIDHV